MVRISVNAVSSTAGWLGHLVIYLAYRQTLRTWPAHSLNTWGNGKQVIWPSLPEAVQSYCRSSKRRHPSPGFLSVVVDDMRAGTGTPRTKVNQANRRGGLPSLFHTYAMDSEGAGNALCRYRHMFERLLRVSTGVEVYFQLWRKHIQKHPATKIWHDQVQGSISDEH